MLRYCRSSLWEVNAPLLIQPDLAVAGWPGLREVNAPLLMQPDLVAAYNAPAQLI